MKFLFTGREFGLLKRGSFTITKRFCDWFANKTEFIEGSKLRLEHLDKFQKVIFRTQVPSAYNIPVNGIALRNVNHLVYIRNEHLTPLLNSCTNGFYYYKRNNKIQHYIPLITPFSVLKIDRSIPCLGFYERNCITQDSFDWFKEMIKNLTVDVDVYFMGNSPKINFTRLSPHIKSVTHTFDNEEFYPNITHYIYPRSKLWDDPFPHSMVEAIQSQCQIISPTIKERTHKDGVDDVLDCIKFHTEFNPDIYFSNDKTILKAENFINFYLKVFDNDFEYSFDRDKYTRFGTWIEREVL